MSTGENINANGARVTAEMIRGAFHRFPQSSEAYVHPQEWAALDLTHLAAVGYPFRAIKTELVPAGEIWFLSSDGTLVGRIVNIHAS